MREGGLRADQASFPPLFFFFPYPNLCSQDFVMERKKCCSAIKE